MSPANGLPDSLSNCKRRFFSSGVTGSEGDDSTIEVASAARFPFQPVTRLEEFSNREWLLSWVKEKVTICKQKQMCGNFRVTGQKCNCAGELGLSVEWRRRKSFFAVSLNPLPVCNRRPRKARLRIVSRGAWLFVSRQHSIKRCADRIKLCAARIKRCADRIKLCAASPLLCGASPLLYALSALRYGNDVVRPQKNVVYFSN